MSGQQLGLLYRESLKIDWSAPLFFRSVSPNPLMKSSGSATVLYLLIKENESIRNIKLQISTKEIILVYPFNRSITLTDLLDHRQYHYRFRRCRCCHSRYWLMQECHIHLSRIRYPTKGLLC